MEMTKEHLTDVCKIGRGDDCCRYISAGRDGIKCGKDDPGLKAIFDRQVEKMTAKGDNCDGWDSYQRNSKV
jgi:hypothetical protein